MSGFIATAPAQPTTAPADIITNDGWFPDISMGATRNAMRLDGTITDQRLRTALLYAISDINRQLFAWRQTHLLLNHPSMASVAPSDTLDGQPRLVMLYQRAVMCAAKAELTEAYRDFDADGTGRRMQDTLPTIDEYRRNSQWAVRDILGQRHTVVELI